MCRLNHMWGAVRHVRRWTYRRGAFPHGTRFGDRQFATEPALHSTAEANVTANPTTTSNVCVIFPGQGAQQVGMGHGLLSHAAARLVFEEINEALQDNISNVMFHGSEVSRSITNENRATA
jgi:hypothetical protein